MYCIIFITFLDGLGAVLKLGRHEWFALRRLITNSRISAFTGGFWNCFLKETSQVDGWATTWNTAAQELPNQRKIEMADWRMK